MYWAYKSWLLLIVLWVSADVYGIDPMAPPGYRGDGQVPGHGLGVNGKKANKPRYVLRQIMVKGDDSSAIINGVIVRVGDKVGKAKVIKIAEKRVTLKLTSGYQVLTLESRYPSVRKPTGVGQ